MAVNNQGSMHPTPPPVGGRTLAVVHNAMYDAWAAYDAKAVGTQLGGELRRPAAERTEANKRQTVSFAAHRALSDLFPRQRATFDAKLVALGYDAAEADADAVVAGTPAAVAIEATDALLEVRHQDGSNQLSNPPYASPEGFYKPVNPAQDVNDFDKSKIVDPNRWAPLTMNGMTHHFLTPHFAASKPFLALNIAEGDEAVVDWKAKVHFDYGRPITMIRHAMDGKKIRGYAGPDQGTKVIDGAKWQPYLKTPAFAAYGSGHTGFTAAGAEIIEWFTGSDAYGGTGVIKAGSSGIETGMPSKDLALKWDTFSEAAQARELARDVWAEALQAGARRSSRPAPPPGR
ncbi:DUF6851 domain-containing protein [Streptomyces sp. NPDC003032]